MDSPHLSYTESEEKEWKHFRLYFFGQEQTKNKLKKTYIWAFLMAENNKEAFYTSCQARNDLVNIRAQVVGLELKNYVFRCKYYSCQQICNYYLHYYYCFDALF